MDIRDKLVLEWTVTETTDEAGRVVRTSQPNEAVVFVEQQFMVNCNSYGRPLFPPWRKREELRRVKGFYHTSEVIDKIEETTGYNHALHISRTDPTMVAYTPSVEAGNEDKQLTTTLGKFLRKHMLLVTDSWIAEQVESHMAEVTGTFECARTASEIRWAYTSMPSDTSCMRYQPSNWYGEGFDVHPSEVYATEHTYVAYIPGENNEDGPTVKARAVVYENGDDKRYVRVYGTPVLEKILKRKGFVKGTLDGARLRRIPIPNTHNTYVMPYLDGPGGNQGDPHCWVVDNGERLIVMHKDAAGKFGREFCAQSKNHSDASVKLLPLPEATWTSDMTGITYDTMTEGRPVYYLGMGGNILKASEDEIFTRRRSQHMLLVVTRYKNANALVWVYDGAPVFKHITTNWLDTDENRVACAYERVTSKYDALPVGTWAYGMGKAIDLTGEDIRVSAGTELVTLVGSDGVLRGMPKVCLSLLPNRKDYRKCGRYNERDVYAFKTNPKLIQSEGGTWFVEGVHDGYGKCAITGKWYATKGLVRVAKWGQGFTVGKDQTDLAVKLLPLVPVVQEWKAISTMTDISLGVATALLNGAHRRAARLVSREAGMQQLLVGAGGELFRVYRIGDVTMVQVIEQLTAVNTRCATGVWGEYDRAEVERFNTVVDMVRAHYDPYVATLQATIDRLEAEAAGQVTIEEGETV